MHFFRRGLFLGLLICMVSQSAGTSHGFFRHGFRRHDPYCCVNSNIKGQVLDYTANHGADRRIWSAALCQKRDMYVYLPPGYDPQLAYSAAIYLHGAMQDEQAFLEEVVPYLDEYIACGKLPPVIIAAPDGSIRGKATVLRSASFWVNSRAGRFEDFVQQDVWGFVENNFRIRPEREAHAMIGASMGGAAAFSHGIKYKQRYKTVIGIMPALNLRWIGCDGNYFAKFDPANWCWRTKMCPLEVVGDLRPFKIRAFELYHPILGHGPAAIAKLSSYNPIEILDCYGLKEGELDMYIGYVGCDEFNIDTQVNSFLYRAKERGLTITTEFLPTGRHNVESGIRLLPGAVNWLASRTPGPVK